MDSAYASGALGAKIHCSYAKTPTASRACMDLLDAVAERERPLLIHVDGPDWDAALLDVARSIPGGKSSSRIAGPAPPRAPPPASPNARTTSTWSCAPRFRICPPCARSCNASVPDKLLFGTDAPLLDAAYALGLYADAGADLVATTRAAREVFAL